MAREKIFLDWIPAGAKVLDVGCGNSRLLLELKNQKNCDVTGIDVSPLVIQSLKPLGINGIVANIEDENFKINESFDYIIASETLEHLRQPEDLIAKLYPRTNYFVISVPNSAFYRFRIGLMFGGRFFIQWAFHPSEHLRYWSHKDFLDWLEAMNLKTVKFKASNGFELRNIWPNMFGHQICYLTRTKDSRLAGNGL